MTSQFLILLFILSPLPGLLAGGSWMAVTPLCAFVLFPLLDHFLPRSPPVPQKKTKSTPLLYLYLPYHPLVILIGANSVRDLPPSALSFWISALSVGIVTGGIGITFAHEWVHKLNPRQKLYGEWLLVWVCYGHYATEHVYGHHKNVGTREDGATARKNEWLQAYIPRALYQVWRGAYRRKPTRTVLHGAASLFIALGMRIFMGPSGMLFFLVQSAVAVLLLTSIDYIEHYGLVRKVNSEGRPESMKPIHSWDSNSLLMGELLIHLQRHADHHMKPLKPYPELELLAEAPQLPTGYAGMIWLAWWPQLFFKVMNPRFRES